MTETIGETITMADLASVLEQVGSTCPCADDGKRLTDQQLLDKLKSFKININREELERLCEENVSPDDICGPWLEKTNQSLLHRADLDWVILCIWELWERWFPDKPSTIRFMQLVERGFAVRMLDDNFLCRVWIESWEELLRIVAKGNFTSIKELDDKIDGLRCTLHWVELFLSTLAKAGPGNVKFSRYRVSVCKDFMKSFPNEDPLFVEFVKISLAEAHFDMQEEATADALYSQWLKEDPQWGRGWIGWSQCYAVNSDPASLQQAEDILNEAVQIQNVRNFKDILLYRAAILNRRGKRHEASKVFAEQRRLLAIAKNEGCDEEAYEACSCGESKYMHPEFEIFDRGESPREMFQYLPKIARKDPCPCGSGRKFKHCCD